ncbi:signal peptidase I [Microgenomates group bacterium]|nr:signal peptidase I [Microgenomates group bacterium]
MSTLLQPERKRPTIKSTLGSFLFDVLETAVFSLAILLIVYIFIVQPHQVDGHSMDPTLQDREYLLTNKLSYRFGLPQKGDIVVFHAPSVACPSGNCDFIKRVIATPGDTLSYQNDLFYVNGQELPEDYLPSNLEFSGESQFLGGRTITLADDEYFVAGDNRPHSSDSRLWGPIKRKSIVGKTFFSYWPLSTFGIIKSGPEATN